MSIRRLRASLLGSVLALIIALAPATAIVSADTPANTPDPPATETTEPVTTPEQPSAPAETPPPAETTPPPANPEPAPASAPAATGPTQPNGADSTTYTYNESTGLWENDHYTWDPLTHQTTPKSPQTYSYNPTTGMWDTTDWLYDATSGQYVENIRSVADPPTNALLAATPDSVNSDQTGNSTFDTFYDAAISGNINTASLTGDAILHGNTVGGNATSGNALAIANLLNLLQSSASFMGGNGISTFSADIQGDVVGDLLIDPSQLGSLTAGNSDPAGQNLIVRTDGNGAINNKLVVDAGSGNAEVSRNTQGGDATSGNADAVANVVNVINSTIGAGQSFLGVVNVYGSLDGDILLPPGFIDSLLASNAPRATLSNIENSDTLAEFNNNQSISNDINATAATGTATVANNTTAGSATSGNGLTNLTILNLTGSDVIGTNNLLVFVNVLGKWYGLIMNAPQGTTAASLGGGITQNTISQAQNTAIESNSDSAITNDIDVRARTGNAAVTENTTGGNARSGNATASINLLNFINNHLSLSDWFGILFINVFGTWTGSFGMDTAAGGDTPATASAPAGGQGSGPTAAQTRVFQFKPSDSGNGFRVEPVDTSGSTGSEQASLPTAVLASATAKPQAGQPSPSLPDHQRAAWVMPVAGLSFGFLFLGTERLLAWRRQRN